MELKEIIDRNYSATVKRGKITEHTNAAHFAFKVAQELEELVNSFTSEDDFDKTELADVVFVCFSMAKHLNIDLVEVMREKMTFNETRTD